MKVLATLENGKKQSNKQKSNFAREAHFFVNFFAVVLLWWGCTPLYELYIRYDTMCRPIGKGFAPFWSENGYTLCPF